MATCLSGWETECLGGLWAPQPGGCLCLLPNPTSRQAAAFRKPWATSPGGTLVLWLCTQSPFPSHHSLVQSCHLSGQHLPPPPGAPSACGLHGLFLPRRQRAPVSRHRVPALRTLKASVQGEGPGPTLPQGRCACRPPPHLLVFTQMSPAQGGPAGSGAQCSPGSILSFLCGPLNIRLKYLHSHHVGPAGQGPCMSPLWPHPQCPAQGGT